MALATIQSNPHLFHIVTPINADCFQSLLSSHPNQPFVEFVCRGLCQGFWPFANTHYGEWPLTWDSSQHTPKMPEEAAFLQEWIDKEVMCGCYLEPFGSDLLPGMFSMPIHAVPKPGSNKHRLVTDHSAGQFALNNMISRDDIAGVTIDNALRYLRQQDPDIDLIL